VQDQGGNDDDVHRILTEDGLAQKLADVIMSGVQISGACLEKINYARTLAEMISAGNYVGVDPEINDQNFLVVGTGECEVGLARVHLKKGCETEEILTYLAQHNLQPAKIEHLLAIGETHEQGRCLFPKLIALGTSWVDGKGIRCFVGMQTDTMTGACRLRLAGDGPWSKNCHFLVARVAA
jgi:hypothetical protein